MGRAARYLCIGCDRPFTTEFFDKQDPNLMCLFCLIQNSNRNGHNISETDDLRTRIDVLHHENKMLRDELALLKNMIFNGNSMSPKLTPRVTQTPPPLPRLCPPRRLSQTYPRRLVSSPSGSSLNRHVSSSYQTPVHNRFNVLSDEMDDCVVIDDCINSDPDVIVSDSLLRNLGRSVNTLSKNKSTTNVYPGAKIEYIDQKVKELPHLSKTSVLVVNVGSNDVFHKRVASQEVIERYRDLIDTLKSRANKSVIIGILPRLYESNYNLSRAIGVNDKLSKLCSDANIGFIDPWTDLMNHRNFFMRDGIHLSHKGTSFMAKQITKHIRLQREPVKNFQ